MIYSRYKKLKDKQNLKKNYELTPIKSTSIRTIKILKTFRMRKKQNFKVQTMQMIMKKDNFQISEPKYSKKTLFQKKIKIKGLKLMKFN